MANTNEPAAFVAGLLTSVAIMSLVMVAVVLPASTDDQFKKDCAEMAQGTIAKNASNICARNGKILYYK